MPYEAEGKIVKIYPTESKTATFTVREFVIEVPDGNYPQFVKFQCVGDRCGIMDNFREGERIKVSFDLRGREWQGKYFTSLNAWRMDKVGEGESSGSSNLPPDPGFPADPFPNYNDAPPARSTAAAASSGGGGGQQFDDLPF